MIVPKVKESWRTRLGQEHEARQTVMTLHSSDNYRRSYDLGPDGELKILLISGPIWPGGTRLYGGSLA